MSQVATTVAVLWWGGVCFLLGLGSGYGLGWLFNRRDEVPPPTPSSEIGRIGRQTDAAIIREAMRYREAERTRQQGGRY